MMLFVVRLIVENFKIAQVTERADWDLNTGQILSIPFILLGIYLMFFFKRKAKDA